MCDPQTSYSPFASPPKGAAVPRSYDPSMPLFTADPLNPLGRRSGSLLGSGTHDEDSVIDATGVHDAQSGGGASAGTAQSAGDGATELAAWVAAREESGSR